MHSSHPTALAATLCRHEAYDARADVWSFGVLLVECLTQQKPYAATYMAPVQIAIQVGAARDPWGLVGCRVARCSPPSVAAAGRAFHARTGCYVLTEFCTPISFPVGGGR